MWVRKGLKSDAAQQDLQTWVWGKTRFAPRWSVCTLPKLMCKSLSCMSKSLLFALPHGQCARCKLAVVDESCWQSLDWSIAWLRASYAAS